MFERNKIDTAEQGLIAVEITLADGQILAGKVAIQLGRNLIDVLNGTTAFLEFMPFEGERTFLAKATVAAMRPLDVARPNGLAVRLRDLEDFDPHGVLGVAGAAPWDVIRQAFVQLAKTYHPDRYSNVQLPDEVASYLAAMARRINVAYATLETSHLARKNAVTLRQEAVYTSARR